MAMRSASHFWAASVYLIFLPAAGLQAAEPVVAGDLVGFSTVVAPFLKQYCVECHGAKEPQADFALHTISGDLLKGPDVEKWQLIADKLALGEMPPEDKPRPDAVSLKRVGDWLRAELQKAGKSTLAEKLLHPGYGNYVGHAALFTPSAEKTAASPPRLWRMHPHVYMTMAEDLTKSREFPQPFALGGGEGIQDFSSLYGLDEPTTDLLIRNAQEIAGWQTRHTIDADGKLKGGFRTLREALLILDPANKQPTREQFETMIRRQYELVLLRQPDADELTRLADFALRTVDSGGLHNGVRMTLAAVLLSPEAVFRIELGAGQPDEHGRVLLGSRELAYAISYALTDRRPDQVLLKTASDGRLASREDVRREVERMLADAKIAKPRIMQFFREYFGYELAIEVFKDAKEFEDHDARVLVGDTDRLIQHILAEDRDVLHELLTTNKSFVNFHSDSRGVRPTNDKKRVQFSYSLPSDWKWTKDQPLELPAAERAGILTQPSWLVAHSLNTENHAIRRGKWIRERLLGGTVPELPITVDAQLPEDPQRTLRERMSVTQENYCWQCHQKMNPLGLPLESYDHFGRFRKAELDRPVDTTGTVAIGAPEVDGDVTSGLEMIRRLAESTRVRQVFVRHAFRYWLGRNETLADSPTLIAADEAYVKSGGSMNALITSLLTSDAFIYRFAGLPAKIDEQGAKLP